MSDDKPDYTDPNIPPGGYPPINGHFVGQIPAPRMKGANDAAYQATEASSRLELLAGHLQTLLVEAGMAVDSAVSEGHYVPTSRHNDTRVLLKRGADLLQDGLILLRRALALSALGTDEVNKAGLGRL